MDRTMQKKRKNKLNLLRIIVLGLLIGGSFYIYRSVIESNISDNEILPNPLIIENANVISTNSDFTEKNFDEIYTGDLILVNKNSQFHFDNENDTVSVFDYKNNDYKVKDKDILLNQGIIDQLNNMMNDYAEKTNDKDIIIVSGHRTLEFQQMLFDDKKAEVGEKEAARWVALPGSSEHHSGFALDFSVLRDNGEAGNFNGNGKQDWLTKNAYQYGFIVRYQSEKENITGVANEPWHFRYVGIPHALIMNDKNMCLEEYIDYLKQFEYGKKHLEIDGFEIYFVRADADKTKIPVPTDRTYTISGNNVDGFIVTIGK